MREPPGFDWGEWVTIITASVFGSILAGIGAAMAWFRGEKKQLRSDMTALSQRMGEYDDKHAAHATEIAVIQTCQQSTEKQLEVIARALEKIFDKLDAGNGRH